MRPPTVRQTLLAALAELEVPVTARELAAETGLYITSVRVTLATLATEGLARRAGSLPIPRGHECTLWLPSGDTL